MMFHKSLSIAIILLFMSVVNKTFLTIVSKSYYFNTMTHIKKNVLLFWLFSSLTYTMEEKNDSTITVAIIEQLTEDFTLQEAYSLLTTCSAIYNLYAQGLPITVANN